MRFWAVSRTHLRRWMTGWRARLTVQGRIAELNPRTEQTVVTHRVVRYVQNLVRYLVTGIQRAHHPIIDHRRRPRLAVQNRMAGLCAIAERTVITQAVIRHVDNPIKHLVTGVDRARYPIIQNRRRPRLAVQCQITRLRTVTKQAVITQGIGRRVDDLVRDLATDDYGVVVMCSSMGREYSLESEQHEHGYFTLALIEALSGQADFNQDGSIYLTEVDAYLSDRIKALTGGKQHPVTTKPATIRSFPLSRP